MFCSRFQRLKSIPAEGMVEHSSSLYWPGRRERKGEGEEREVGRRKGKREGEYVFFSFLPFMTPSSEPVEWAPLTFKGS